MKNKKGVLEISIGTIVVIGLLIVVLILGILLISRFFVEPHFKIYEEVCEWKSISYNIPKLCEEVVCDCAKNTTNPCMAYCFYCPNEIMIEKEQICEQIEVNEMIVCCSNISNGYNNESTSICLPEENLEFFDIPCEPLKKEDLTTEWLDENSECIEWCDYELYRKPLCYNSIEESLHDWEKIDNLICQKYKFGNYTIETWEQSK